MKAPQKLCPMCQKPTEPTYRPFCSARCADLDLSGWLSERYVLPENADIDDEEEGEVPRH